MKVLVVDDEFSVLRSIKNHLQQHKWQVAVAESYEQAKKMLETEEFDVIICDYHLSHDQNARHGLDLIREIRAEGIQTPVIFLTGLKIDHITPWAALDSGGDDFLRKPWRPQELVARINAVVRRRFAAQNNATNIIQHGDISLNIDLRRTFVQEKEVYLGNILFLILSKLLQKPGTLLGYKALINYVWGTNSAVSQERKNTLRVHMTHLKKALSEKYARHIRTVHGQGYVWEG